MLVVAGNERALRSGPARKRQIGQCKMTIVKACSFLAKQAGRKKTPVPCLVKNQVRSSKNAIGLVLQILAGLNPKYSSIR